MVGDNLWELEGGGKTGKFDDLCVTDKDGLELKEGSLEVEKRSETEANGDAFNVGPGEILPEFTTLAGGLSSDLTFFV